MATAPLRRNRDFMLLQTGQLLSTAGTQSASIAYPLLVLAVTHSPGKAGLVAFIRLAPYAIFGLFAGVAVDRWDRRRLMIASDAVRVVATAGLAAAILAHSVAFWQIAVVTFVEGTGFVFFSLGETGAVRAVVAPAELPAATAAQTGRASVVRLVGPPLGGVLFGVARAVPFLVDAVSYAFSSVSLLAMRTPFQEVRERDRSPLRTQIADGFRFLWSRPFLRTSSVVFALSGFVLLGATLIVIVAGKRQGLSSGEVGLLVSAFSAATLAGSFASGFVRRRLSVRAILLAELWTTAAIAVFLVWPSAYVLALGLVPQSFVIPASDSVVISYRVAVTPDHLLGRVNGVARTIGLLAAPLGPLLAGFLIGNFSTRAAVAVFAALGLAIAIWGTLSPALRSAPDIGELELLSHEAASSR
jgi:MFS family permease